MTHVLHRGSSQSRSTCPLCPTISPVPPKQGPEVTLQSTLHHWWLLCGSTSCAEFPWKPASHTCQRGWAAPNPGRCRCQSLWVPLPPSLAPASLLVVFPGQRQQRGAAGQGETPLLSTAEDPGGTQLTPSACLALCRLWLQVAHKNVQLLAWGDARDAFLAEE